MLPDALYEKAKRFASDREMSLAEVTRRSLEMLLDRYPVDKPSGSWQLPAVDCGGIQVDLKDLKALTADEEIQRSIS